MTDLELEGEILLARFNRLTAELLRGASNRWCFRPWEAAVSPDAGSRKYPPPDGAEAEVEQSPMERLCYGSE